MNGSPLRALTHIFFTKFWFLRLSRNEWKPVEGIDTDLWIRLALSSLNGRNEWKPVEGIDTHRKVLFDF